MNRLLLSAFCALALGFAGAAHGASVYERGNTADPATLDPQKATTPAEANILRDLYEGLVVYDAAGKTIPGAAESWTVSADGLTWTFRLRPAQWSNGDPVTAEDFVRAFRHLMTRDTAAPDAALFSAITNAATVASGTVSAYSLGVKASDPATLRIELDRPVPYLLELLARPSAMPTHGGAPATAPTRDVVVNGPYQIADFTAGEQLRLSRNPFFHDADNVAIDSVIYRPLAPDVAVRLFQLGSLQSNNNVPPFRIAELKEELGDSLRVAPYLGSYFYMFNAAAGPLADLRVRQALSLAVDRDRLATLVWGDAMLPSLQLVPAGIAPYGEAAAVEAGPADPEERVTAAKALLAEAGYGEDKPLSLTIAVAASPLNRMTAAAIVADWAPVGVKATIAETDADAHYRDLEAGGPVEVASVAWIGDFNDAGNFLELLRHREDGPNLARYGNAAFGALLDEAAATQDAAVRSALLFKADRLAMGDVAVLPLLQYTSLNLVSPKLLGWQDNVLDVHPTRWLSLAEGQDESE